MRCLKPLLTLVMTNSVCIGGAHKRCEGVSNYYTLDECRTLCGECKYVYTVALNCYIAKVLPAKYHITEHRQWHVAKKGLYCLCKSA